MSKYYKAEDVEIAIADALQFESEVGRPYKVFLDSAKDMLKNLQTIEVSEDAISREWVLNRLAKYQKDYTSNELDDWQNTIVEWITTDIEDAPSVVPTEKIGKWVKVPGYATPGGDPVWECSECGKGRHVYGIEAPSYQKDVSNQQWVTCPNCGARME